MWETIIFFLRLSSSRQALQNSFNFPAPVTVGHYSGNSFTRCEAVMLFCSLDPSPRALCLPLGGGLQWTLLFCVRSDKAWAFRASNTDLVELDNPSLTLEDPSRSSQPCGTHGSRYRSNSMRMRNTHYVIYFATFYLLFLFSKSCPIIIPEYLAQA